MLFSVKDTAFIPTKTQVKEILAFLVKKEHVQFDSNLEQIDLPAEQQWDQRPVIEEKIASYTNTLDLALPKMATFWDKLFGKEHVAKHGSFSRQFAPGLKVTDFNVFSVMDDYWEEGEPDTRFVILWQGLYPGSFDMQQLPDVIKQFPILYQDFIFALENIIGREIFFRELIT